MNKLPHDYWYVFPCQVAPIKLSKGQKPRMPYKKFDTKDEAWECLNKAVIDGQYFAERIKQGTIESLNKYYDNKRTLPQLPKAGNGDEKATE